ncbi:hypothetical protein GH714_023052 [Hevea brasiliensis]|uniref:Ankyrin repeat domain-containing protein n=1 Tax=Hevea brasiliensis TaxID=3981 RepID=A0A6A6M388_HEVBR|nr:hypothetical protein GH714_023052 [Hevea brasiliensis]
MEDISKYSHSPVHFAVARRDYAALRCIISTLPSLAKAGEVKTEQESLAAEVRADAVSAVIDRRDVPGRETPLHLAVKLRDPISAEILMAAGADWSLQNENGWSALQEAVCTREEQIAMIIARHYQPLAWAKWCRRLPRIVASATLSVRSNISLLGRGVFFKDSNISLPPGSLIVLAHKEKEVTNALEGAGAQPTEAEVAHEVALMSQTNMYRPGIDVTQAELVPYLNWRRQERTEMVGNWKAKVYDMFHVMVSVKSRRVPGAMTDEELFAADDEDRPVNGADNDEFDDVLTAEERKQLDTALRMGNSDGLCEDEELGSSSIKKMDLERFSKLAPEGGNQKSVDNKKSSSEFSREDLGDTKKGKDKGSKKKKKKGVSSESKHESEYKKGLRPVLWLTPDFPLKTEELLPLLDILANKVKAVRRLRELLTTKLPQGTFPVKVAIPIVPTIRVLVTFTKFEELQPVEEFSTPLSSPAHFQDAKSKEAEGSTSWISWMRGSRGGQSSDSDSHRYKDEIDPFHIPSDYTWVDANEKKRRMKAKKSKSKKHRKQAAARGGDGGTHQLSEDVEE